MAGLNEVGGEHGGDLLLNFGLLKMRISVGTDVDRSGLGKEVDMVFWHGGGGAEAGRTS